MLRAWESSRAEGLGFPEFGLRLRLLTSKEGYPFPHWLKSMQVQITTKTASLNILQLGHSPLY